MNGKKYAEWATHYDPNGLEIKHLNAHNIFFKQKRVLEVGCGTGRFTKRILEDCEKITCIDPDSEALAVFDTQISSPKVQVICGTLETAELKAGYYDYVIFPWSMYLITNRDEILLLSKKYLKPGGNIIILQAQSGEYEEEISKLYRSYNSLGAYNSACDTLPSDVKRIFGNVTSDILSTYFEFESIDQVIDCSVFFIEDEEGQQPRMSDIIRLKERLRSYISPGGTIVMSDNVSVVIATKHEEKNEMPKLGVLQVELETKQTGDNIVFSCGIHNVGDTPIGLNNTFLFVDEGIYNTDSHQYEFPFFQKKFLGITGVADEDCIGCALCRKGVAMYPMEYQHIKSFYTNLDKLFCRCYPLPHLSSKSILYMAPKERFSEELVVKIPKGVYRAILICVPNQETCDCMCCNRCFCVI